MQDKQTGRMDRITEEEFKRVRAMGLPAFEVGETLVLRGGRFRVEEITEEGLRLVGVPFASTVARVSAARRGRR